jgi:7,8-dihydropterin-6-yl-methyl-4-(beta-D-ribofuranosyl)aminobenzene 5'-phosphate synthase
MKITVLADNLVYGKDLKAEHGYSLWIECGGKKILFDAGQSSVFAENAAVLGIKLEEADAAVLSHGHYDHAGGMELFFKLNRTAPLYLKEEALQAKHGVRGYIGLPFDTEPYSKRLKFVKQKFEAAPGLFIMPEISVHDKNGTRFKGFKIISGTEELQDEFRDELFLAAAGTEKLSVISSCSHSGILNIIQSAEQLLGKKTAFVLGGFHLKDSSSAEIRLFAEKLKERRIEKLVTGHCTGIEAYAELKALMPESCHSYAGMVLEL